MIYKNNPDYIVKLFRGAIGINSGGEIGAIGVKSSILYK